MAVTIYSIINALARQSGCVWDFPDPTPVSCVNGTVTDAATRKQYKCTLKRVPEGTAVVYDLEVHGITSWHVKSGKATAGIVSQLVDLIARDVIRNTVHNFLKADPLLPEAVRACKEPVFTLALSAEAMQDAVAGAFHSLACDARLKQLIVEALGDSVFDIEGYEAKVLLEEADDVPVLNIHMPDTIEFSAAIVDPLGVAEDIAVETPLPRSMCKVSRKKLSAWLPAIKDLVIDNVYELYVKGVPTTIFDLQTVLEAAGLYLTDAALSCLSEDPVIAFEYSFLHEGKLVYGSLDIGATVHHNEDQTSVSYGLNENDLGIVRARYLNTGEDICEYLARAIHYMTERHVRAMLWENGYCTEFSLDEVLAKCGFQLTKKAAKFLRERTQDMTGVMYCENEVVYYSYNYTASTTHNVVEVNDLRTHNL